MVDETLIVIFSGLIGAIIGSIITYWFSIKLLKRDFELKNKKEYLEKVIRWISIEQREIEDNLEKIKKTPWGKILSENNKIDLQKARDKMGEFQILMNSTLIFCDKQLREQIISLTKIENSILKEMTKQDNKNINEIETKLKDWINQKDKVVYLIKEELKQ